VINSSRLHKPDARDGQPALMFADGEEPSMIMRADEEEMESPIHQQLAPNQMQRSRPGRQ